jgi:hypothetical protein
VRLCRRSAVGRPQLEATYQFGLIKSETSRLDPRARVRHGVDVLGPQILDPAVLVSYRFVVAGFLIWALGSGSDGLGRPIPLRPVSLTYEPLCFIRINPQSTSVQQKL